MEAALILLGDSFVQGYYLYDHETIAARLGERTGLHTLSAGVGGFSTDQQFILLQQLLAAHDPSWVVLIFFANDLLYLQSTTVGIDCQVLGMRLLIDGELDDGPDDPEDWPYKSVLEAIKDGWRVISFPNLALLMDESKTYGLGHEFILEKWR